MSRTFKDRPHWVKKNDPSFRPFIEHDHTSGECVEETFEEIRNFAGGQVDWKISNQHARRCKKRNYYTEYCTKDDPHTSYFSRCWTRIWNWDGRNQFIPCPGREAYTVDPDAPCSCDRHPEPSRSTCYIDFPRSVGMDEIYTGPSRSDHVNLFGTRPERTRVRDGLRGMVKDYNANGDLSDENLDFVPGYYKPRGWFWAH